MRSTRLAIVALAALTASPAVGQEHMWTEARPDGVAPLGVLGDRVLEAGSVEFRYLFARTRFDGVQFENAQVAPGSVLDFYATTPLQGVSARHTVAAAYGLTDRIGLMATVGWVDLSRDIANDEFFLTTQSSGLSDLYVEIQGEFYRSGPFRAHLSAGAEIPVGSTDEQDDLLDLSDQLLPYRMQPGTGSFSAVPGVTAQVQNERGSVGAQVKARVRLDTNDRGYQLGDEVDARLWAAVRLNRFFSVSSGLHVRNFGSIEGRNPALNVTRDPAEDPSFSGGRRVDVPLGLNFLAAEGPLEGHRLNVEFFWPVHQDYENFRQRADWGFRVGWQRAFF
jgi:hypothetical protein